MIEGDKVEVVYVEACGTPRPWHFDLEEYGNEGLVDDTRLATVDSEHPSQSSQVATLAKNNAGACEWAMCGSCVRGDELSPTYSWG